MIYVRGTRDDLQKEVEKLQQLQAWQGPQSLM